MFRGKQSFLVQTHYNPDPDAISAAEMGPGEYDLGARKVVVLANGRCTVPGEGYLSGSTLPGASARTRAVAIGSLLDNQYRVVGFSLHADPPYMFHFALDADE